MKLPLHRADPVKNHKHYTNFFHCKFDWAKRHDSYNNHGLRRK